MKFDEKLHFQCLGETRTCSMLRRILKNRLLTKKYDGDVL